MIKTIATYKSNGKYNPETDRVDYQIETKEIEAKWGDSVEIDGVETKSIHLFPTYLNDMIDDGYIIVKKSNTEFIVFNSMVRYNDFPHRNDFNNLDEAIKFIDTLRSIVYEN